MSQTDPIPSPLIRPMSFAPHLGCLCAEPPAECIGCARAICPECSMEYSAELLCVRCADNWCDDCKRIGDHAEGCSAAAAIARDDDAEQRSDFDREEM